MQCQMYPALERFIDCFGSIGRQYKDIPITFDNPWGLLASIVMRLWGIATVGKERRFNYAPNDPGITLARTCRTHRTGGQLPTSRPILALVESNFYFLGLPTRLSRTEDVEWLSSLVCYSFRH